MKNKNHNCHTCHQPLKYRGNRIYICKNTACQEHNKLIQYDPNTLPPNNKGIPDIYPNFRSIPPYFPGKFRGLQP